MTVLNVAIPVTTLSTRLVVRKGQPWSVIEHLLLEAITRVPSSRGVLAQRFNLILPIVDAALIRLARALWIEMHITPEGLMWRANARGRAALSEEELPSPGRILSRPITLLIDRLAGHLFDPRELTHGTLEHMQQVAEYQPLCVLPPLLPEAIYRIDELVLRLRDDEQLLQIDATMERRIDKVAILRLASEEIEGLPSNQERPELVEAIRAGVKSAKLSGASPARPPRRPLASNSPVLQRHPICFAPQDLIVGGAAHRGSLEEVFARAISRIILHSTFVSEQVFRHHLPAMLAAVERGVQINVLWGQDPPQAGEEADTRSSASVIASLVDDPQIASLGGRLRLHQQSTRSHAKLIVADLDRRGEYSAWVGSCNWLASNLQSVEASIRIRTPVLVAEVIRSVSNLLYASENEEPELPLSLLRIARSLERRLLPEKPNAMAYLVVGARHQECVLSARDQARQRIFVMSHRLSELITPAVLVPLARARTRRPLTVTVLYGRQQDQVSTEVVQQVEQQARANGIALKRIRDPRIHAKVLAWDSDMIVITSQNWLSADAMEATLATELGVAVESKGIADRLVGRIQDIVQLHGTRKGRRTKGSRSRSRVSRI